MSPAPFLPVECARPAAMDSLAVSDWEECRAAVLEDMAAGGRLTALFGRPAGSETEIHTVTHCPPDKVFRWRRARIGRSFAALTPDCPAAQGFEREIAEQWGAVPEGHPWLKPLRYHRGYALGRDAWGRSPDEPILPAVGDFYRVAGDGIHEVAVGPVHAGVIEPGHFRFQCNGEEVLHLEIALGYQHRGVETALWKGWNKRTLPYMETLAGDTSVGHATACCRLLEGLGGRMPSLRSRIIGAIALELERLANHAGDLGALANDVGFLPTASFCGRLRGDFLNLTAALCGNRFGRGLVRPGGLGIPVESATLQRVRQRLEEIWPDLAGAVDLLWTTPSVRARFSGVGKLEASTAGRLGIVGVAARACGIARDVRRDFPTPVDERLAWEPPTHLDGTVHSRAWIRWMECAISRDILRHLLDGAEAAPEPAAEDRPFPLAPASVAVSVVEGWRGEIVHLVITDPAGQLAHYKVVDPSFRNWIGLAVALRGQQISDFPLCNKSFNLSYCGHDL